MELYVTLALCFLPLLAGIVFSILRISAFRPLHALRAVIAGFAALVPIIVVQFAVTRLFGISPASLGGVFISAVLFNGLTEESAKAAFLFLLPSKTHTQASFIAMAFIAGNAVGSFEALIYCIAGTNYSVLRLFTAVILHALCSALSGIFVWTFKNGKARTAVFVSAVFCHGIYNFFAGFKGSLWYFSVFALLFALIRLRYYYTEAAFARSSI